MTCVLEMACTIIYLAQATLVFDIMLIIIFLSVMINKVLFNTYIAVKKKANNFA